MLLPKLKVRELFPAPPNSSPKHGFRAHDNDYLGVQFGVNNVSDLLWDHDDLGGWRGPAWASVYPYQFHVIGATETRNPATQDSPTSHLPNGADVTVSYALPLSGGAGGPSIPSTSRLAIVRCSDNQVVYNDTHTSTAGAGINPTLNSHTVPALPAGSYIVWLHCEAIEMPQELPADYERVTGYVRIPDEFRYIENDVEYVWDWEHDVGMRPSNPNQIALDGETDMYHEHNLLRQANALKSRSEWTSYIRYQGAQDSEWATIQLQVGGGSWDAGIASPFPGAALVKGDGSGGSEAVNFDARARNVMASWNQGGKVRIAGCIATRSGPGLGYWELHSDGSSTLLGVKAPDIQTDYVCAFSQLGHYPSDIWIDGSWFDEDETEWVLTIGYLFKLNKFEVDIAERMVGIPLETQGHPGGRVLRRADGMLVFFTDFFVDQQQGFFYNRMLIQGSTRREAIGTVFHDDNSSDLYYNKLYSFRQNKALCTTTGEPQKDVITTLDYLDGETWHRTDTIQYDAHQFNWQRLRAIHTSEGLRLLAAGRTRSTHPLPIWGVVDGSQFKQAYCPWFTRRMEPALQPLGGEECYCVAFKFDDEMGDNKKLISISSEFEKICFSYDDVDSYVASLDSLDEVEVNPNKLPRYLVFRGIGVVANTAGGYLYPASALPASHDGYLELTITSTEARYTVAQPLAFSPDVWCRFCFTVATESSVINETLELEPCASNAAEALGDDNYFILRKEVTSEPWLSIQVSDINEFIDSIARTLNSYGIEKANLWYRVDGTGGDLTSFDRRAAWDRPTPLYMPAFEHVDVCIIVPNSATVRAPVLAQRNSA